MRRILLAIALIAMIFFMMSASARAVPGLINYQGKLTDPNNNHLEGEYIIIFRIYTVQTGGTHQWEEVKTVEVLEGIYNVQLGAGEGNALPLDLFNNDELYLEIQIYNPDTLSVETLSPRQRLTSTAFAMKAGNADTAWDADTVDGKHADEFLSTSDGTQTKSGGLNITGSVGIGERFGTSNPENPFTIDTLRTGTQKLDQSQTSKNFSDLLNAGWQSFTVSIDGPITRIEVLSTSGWSWGNTTLKIYKGEGTGGNLLYEKGYEIGTAPADGIIVFEILLKSAPILEKGSLYTFQIDNANRLIWADFSNPYINGNSSIGSEYDLWFNTYVNEDYNHGGVIAVTDSGNVGIGTTEPEAKLDIAGDAKIRDGLKPDYDSGWIPENSSPDHIRTLDHNLGVYPTRIQIWFSPDNPPSDWISPMGVDQMNYPQVYNNYKNPAGIVVNKTQIVLHFYGAVYLFSRYGAPAASTWYNYNSGYIRVMLWK